MKLLQDFTVFITTAQHSSFSQAAKVLNLTPAAISATIKRLEEQFDCVLFVRSTRSLRITSEGEILLKQCQIATDSIYDGLKVIKHSSSELSGSIKLAMPSDLGRNLILPWVDEFLNLHPNVTITAELADSITNMYQNPIDISLRYGIPPDSNMIALPICKKNYRVVCASPHYLENKQQITHPNELRQANCIRFMISGSLQSNWHFSKGNELLDIEVSGNRISSDGDAIKRWLIAGHGIGYKSLLDISYELSQGKLVTVLDCWTGDPAPLYMVCTDKRQLNPTVKALRAFLIEKCHQQLLEL